MRSTSYRVTSVPPLLAMVVLAIFSDACELSVQQPDEPGEAVAFDDVAGTTHEEAIAEVAGAGVAEGFDDGTFRPGEPVTRGQMATFLSRALEF